MKTLSRKQLALGLSVVVDAVNPLMFVRLMFVREDDAELAAEFSAALFVIVNVCSDSALHREGVERRMGHDEHHEGDCLVLDVVDPIEAERRGRPRRRRIP